MKSTLTCLAVFACTLWLPTATQAQNSVTFWSPTQVQTSAGTVQPEGYFLGGKWVRSVGTGQDVFFSIFSPFNSNPSAAITYPFCKMGLTYHVDGTQAFPTILSPGSASAGSPNETVYCNGRPSHPVVGTFGSGNQEGVFSGIATKGWILGHAQFGSLLWPALTSASTFAVHPGTTGSLPNLGVPQGESPSGVSQGIMGHPVHSDSGRRTIIFESSANIFAFGTVTEFTNQVPKSGRFHAINGLGQTLWRTNFLQGTLPGLPVGSHRVGQVDMALNSETNTYFAVAEVVTQGSSAPTSQLVLTAIDVSSGAITQQRVIPNLSWNPQTTGLPWIGSLVVGNFSSAPGKELLMVIQRNGQSAVLLFDRNNLISDTPSALNGGAGVRFVAGDLNQDSFDDLVWTDAWGYGIIAYSVAQDAALFYRDLTQIYPGQTLGQQEISGLTIANLKQGTATPGELPGIAFVTRRAVFGSSASGTAQYSLYALDHDGNPFPGYPVVGSRQEPNYFSAGQLYYGFGPATRRPSPYIRQESGHTTVTYAMGPSIAHFSLSTVAWRDNLACWPQESSTNGSTAETRPCVSTLPPIVPVIIRPTPTPTPSSSPSPHPGKGLRGITPAGGP